MVNNFQDESMAGESQEKVLFPLSLLLDIDNRFWAWKPVKKYRLLFKVSKLMDIIDIS